MAYTISGMMTDPGEITALFGGTEVEETAPDNSAVETQEPEVLDDDDTQEVTEEIPVNATAEELFEEEEFSERVGNDNDDTEGTERGLSETEGSSPAKLYSSIANSLAEDGALSNLSEEDLKEVKDSETLINAMKKQLNSMLDDTQKRIKDALDSGMEVSVIKQYENTINYLDNISDSQLEEETQEGEKLRKALIYQYQINLGLSEDRANKMVERAFSGGTDIEDAKEYLEALKDFYRDKYTEQINAGKKEVQERKKQQEEEIKKFKNTLLKDAHILGDIEVDERTRKLAFENWMTPTHKNEQGNYQSAIQKYIAENPMDFQMKVALLFTMTDGFTKMGNVLKQTVKKEKKKAMQELEKVVNNTQRNSFGSLNLFGKDEDSSFNNLQFAPKSAWK